MNFYLVSSPIPGVQYAQLQHFTSEVKHRAESLQESSRDTIAKLGIDVSHADKVHSEMYYAVEELHCLLAQVCRLPV